MVVLQLSKMYYTIYVCASCCDVCDLRDRESDTAVQLYEYVQRSRLHLQVQPVLVCRYIKVIADNVIYDTR